MLLKLGKTQINRMYMNHNISKSEKMQNKDVKAERLCCIFAIRRFFFLKAQSVYGDYPRIAANCKDRC